MTKNELKTGYVIVNRDGYLGVVIRDEEAYILYQEIGMDSLEQRVVHLPGAEHIVIVYDQLQEDRYVNIDLPKQYANCALESRKHTGKELTGSISCHIPENGFTLHSRCIACRMDKNGVFQSLKSEDYRRVMAYFPDR